MVLSETRGLELFVVVRGGIGLLERLGAKHRFSLTRLGMLTLEPERRKIMAIAAMNPR
jgi:hypothetical protein